jgi:flagellar protein FliS
MNTMSPWKSYKQVATQTASPGQLILMLYDGAIRFLEQARRGFHHDDPLEYNLTINNNVQKAQAIITELNGALNIKDGGELALTLNRLYDYFDRRLMEANLRKDEEAIIEIINRLTILREAWQEMLGQNATTNTANLRSALAI